MVFSVLGVVFVVLWGDFCVWLQGSPKVYDSSLVVYFLMFCWFRAGFVMAPWFVWLFLRFDFFSLVVLWCVICLMIVTFFLPALDSLGCFVVFCVC